MIDQHGTLVIQVTPEIINTAIPKDSGHCIVSDALREALPHARRVSTDLQTIRYSNPENGKRYIYLTPASLQRMLANFDLGVRPEPGLYRIGRPVQIIPMRRNEGSGKRTPAGKKRVTKAKVSGAVPTVLGGKTPPSAALSDAPASATLSDRLPGRRREFGLRSIKYAESITREEES